MVELSFFLKKIMNQTMTKLALATAALLPFFAHAQSQVNLYGLVDMGVNRVSNVQGQNLTELRSGNMLASRFGIRGQEDLGAGTKVAFQLEAGLGADTGAVGAADSYWNRQSWLGLAQQGVGELRLGRQLTVMNDAFGTYGASTYMGTQTAAVEGTGSKDSAAGHYNAMLSGTRLSNMVKFNSADMAGFKVRAMVALGEQAGSDKAGRSESLGVTYAKHQIEAGVVYHVTHGADSAQQNSDRVWGVGASYKFLDGARVGFTATQEKNAKHVVGNDANTYAVLGLLPIQQWTLMASYQKLDDKSARNHDVNQLNLGVKYTLSKRTEVYSLFSLQKVDNGGVAGMFSKTSSNDKQNQFNVGVRHAF